MLQRLRSALTNLLGQVAKPSLVLEHFLLPRPVDVIREQLGVELEPGELLLLAEQFCAEWDRAPVPYLVVHDALHVLLGAAPTPGGERQVLEFQLAHLCFDPVPLGVYTVVMGAAGLRGFGHRVRVAQQMLRFARSWLDRASAEESERLALSFLLEAREFEARHHVRITP